MFSAKLNSLKVHKKRFILDPLNFYSLGSALLINIIHWALLYFKLGHASGTILLHYNVVYGPDFVDKARFIFLIPITALAMLIVNFAFSNYFFRKEKLAGVFLNFANIAIQLIFLVASIAVIMINE